MDNAYCQYLVKYTNIYGQEERALFLDFERANQFLTKYHDAVLMGLVEVPLNDIIKVNE